VKRFSFGKNSRLISNRQFETVLSQRLRRSDDLLILYTAQNDCGRVRLGVSVGKSCGNAVVRNRLKRLVREAFRQSADQIPAGFDYVIMLSPKWLKKAGLSENAKTAAMKLTSEQVKKSLIQLAAEAVKLVKNDL
jgi:ribonuclease P protein component